MSGIAQVQGPASLETCQGLFLFPFLKQRWSLFLLTRSGSQDRDLLWDRDGKEKFLGLEL